MKTTALEISHLCYLNIRDSVRALYRSCGGIAVNPKPALVGEGKRALHATEITIEI